MDNITSTTPLVTPTFRSPDGIRLINPTFNPYTILVPSSSVPTLAQDSASTSISNLSDTPLSRNTGQEDINSTFTGLNVFSHGLIPSGSKPPQYTHIPPNINTTLPPNPFLLLLQLQINKVIPSSSTSLPPTSKPAPSNNNAPMFQRQVTRGAHINPNGCRNFQQTMDLTTRQNITSQQSKSNKNGPPAGCYKAR
eukprot:TRINITY_DN3091_c0_g1_i10.p1 TRINITY_DN3091_c0_g1~~TRINITY_DN3091_c0_g1_i10.p1  ORF type:complete len:195 (-),score=7.53 TRINITY_DN3091_c0_g1_i10:1930-2514(-)